MSLAAALDLSGRAALVTGAARGNGFAIAKGLAEAGAFVMLADIDGAGAARAAAAIPGAAATALDVADAASCAAAAEAARAAFGPVSILVNNAGIIARAPLGADGFEAEWERVLAVNAGGAMRMTRACLPQLRETRGAVVNVASIMAERGAPGLAAYAASKGALLQLTRALAAELAPDGVRVNAIAPGVIETEMTAATRANPEAIGRFLAHTPMGRVGKPEELAGPTLFLVSGLASYVTGAMLAVDGGYLTI
ncbi:MAG: SDR family NAD(P)-dependent oxidoreductase [Pikeienuella sp.]|uniref:SDR family NAD(P)-dependent oxidoreductase n=1 Tax=Pikeienuella sp. TaxID=2831957 RepID=UPI003918A42E